ncbi:MAG: potD [Gammaproteobacteria bacterium]|jgi:spermidine/putrescine transport system substrate-binding protein|nr:potD [Gammaproteobacteria bacterium]
MKYTFRALNVGFVSCVCSQKSCINLYTPFARKFPASPKFKSLWVYWLGLILLSSFSTLAMAESNVVNVYVWSQELSPKIVENFQKETGIKVNYSTFDSNEVLYAKMKASQQSQYDVIEPSSYYITRMAREGMIEKIDLKALSNYHNLNPAFQHPEYDPGGEYSIPWVWGLTGIFVNRRYYPDDKITAWRDLWSARYHGALLLLDDPREVFNIGLLTLKYNPNDQNVSHLKEAYENLVSLSPNVRVYNSSSVPSMLTDEDVAMGIAWGSDVYKAQVENPNIEFIYPKEGFVIWVDAFAIPKNPPHRENAYKFLNYILKAQTAALQVTESYYPTANKAAMAYLPKEIVDSEILFPGPETMKRGHFQSDINDDAIEALSRYWQLLKLQ